MNSKGHNTDIGSVVYEYDSWSRISKKASEGMKLSYYILTNALMISIDHSLPQKDSHTYNQLWINTHKAAPSINIEFPDIRSLGSLGGGTHRKYCHQGFFPENLCGSRKEIWEFRRDNILIPSTAIAFNIDRDNPATTIIAIIGYYLHMLGDLYAGDSKHMNGINSYSKLLLKFSEDLNLLAGRIDACHSNLDTLISKLYGAAHHQTTKRYSSYDATGKMYHFSRDYLRKSVPPVIEELISIRPQNIDLLAK